MNTGYRQDAETRIEGKITIEGLKHSLSIYKHKGNQDNWTYLKLWTIKLNTRIEEQEIANKNKDKTHLCTKLYMKGNAGEG